MATPKELRNELLGKTLVENLEKRHFEAYYCPTAAEALEKAVSLIPEKVPYPGAVPQPFVKWV